MSFARFDPVANAARRQAEKQANLNALASRAIKPRASTYAGSTSGEPVEKEGVVKSAAYERAAKALGYCMRCDCKVIPLTGGLDFCHADLGKGQGFKTDCRRGWPGCRACHEFVGRKLPKHVRRAVEILLAVMTRAAIDEAGTWPKRLPRWMQ